MHSQSPLDKLPELICLTSIGGTEFGHLAGFQPYVLRNLLVKGGFLGHPLNRYIYKSKSQLNNAFVYIIREYIHPSFLICTMRLLHLFTQNYFED